MQYMPSPESGSRVSPVLPTWTEKKRKRVFTKENWNVVPEGGEMDSREANPCDGHCWGHVGVP